MAEDRSASPAVKRLVPKKPRGLTLVITGNGKGKTTSALGMALRASGHGLRVCIIQFMKGDLYSGEWDAVRQLAGVELFTAGKGFCGLGGSPHPFAEHRADAQTAVELARSKMVSGRFDMLVLDEINNALHLKLVDLPQVLELLRGKPATLHLILTGRDAHPQVIEKADTVSEVRDIKHALRRNIEPQPGVDY